ncbi:ethanolamine permease [Priestia aryabhattai]|uniref:ethanolamine permease n=1 Tax=Priestia aryabhattai TaxID=412384 RepID=UPI0039825A5B
MDNNELNKTLRPFQLWVIGVGIVISGNFLGWNFGLLESGYVGMLIAICLMAIMYLFMCFGISELSTIMPYAGGPYSFARRAMGPYIGFITGIGVILEYFIAGTVVSIGVGAYISFLFPTISTLLAAAIMYVFFSIIHIIGVKEYARLEGVLVIISLTLLVLMYFVGFPHIDTAKLIGGINGSLIPSGFKGVLIAIPYAMWLFLGIEMLPMMAEETRNVKKDMSKGILTGMVTLLILAILTTLLAIGLAGIEQMSNAKDPLPMAVATAFGDTYWLAQMLASIGLIGLIASFSGIILAYSRQIFSLSRSRYLPGFLSKLHNKRKTPYVAIALPSILGLLIIMFFNPNDLILVATFGALVSYITMNLSVIILRKKEPDLVRYYKTPLYPIAPIVSIILAVIALIANFLTNLSFFWISLGVFAIATIYYFAWGKNNINSHAPEEQFIQNLSHQDIQNENMTV